MRSPLLPVAIVATTLAILPAASADSSSKRGLCFVPNAKWPQDNYIWTRSPSDLTWYYNYGPSPSPVYNNLTQQDFEFVPMLWGAPSDVNDTTFLTTVKNLVDQGTNITNVLTFNEPDMATSGGSSVDPSFGAQVWVNNIIPLQEMGIRVGLPAPTGGWGGLPWLRQFLGNCSELISDGQKTKKNCTYDFVGVHWYGNFEGLASHLGEYAAAFPNTSMWVTEYNMDNQALEYTQWFYNASADYMDKLDYVERYSLFGAFRSSVSNVGPNATMLSAGGQLTDIGAWYLGEQATGVKPTDKSPAPRLSIPLWSLLAALLAIVIMVVS
ncbi:putative glycoside catalytic core protein [Phaeoacremonium minimum UCRPA7]|uniref:Putative glycoside catalytic core protein n=1 Tax=Phaeoacremonium minimum (strain UCR-PA7) TaxID=1286976 RepID=R8BLF7_PHAM7|nr:putative glycoside catalytic core protein [Phaeoacremonium minimum UCRPA7]EOO00167.1 putative glycoside catalytic core protein [Phaeoacremonium minimum UCRPA7]